MVGRLGKGRRWVLVGAVIVVAIGAAAAGVVAFWVSSSSSHVVTGPAATAAQARATVPQLTGAVPLAAVERVAGGLVSHHRSGDCQAATSQLGAAGSPTALRQDAAGLADPVAADIAANVVTAAAQVLADCASTSRPSAADVASLRTVTAQLAARVREDRRQ